MRLRTMLPSVSFAGALLLTGLAAIPAAAQTPWFGFYRLPERCSYWLKTEAVARYYPPNSPQVIVEDRDELNGSDPGTVTSSASAGGAHADATVQFVTAPDGTTSVSVGATHTDGLTDADMASDANVKSDDTTTTVSELRGGGLPDGTTFTLSVRIDIQVNDGGNYTEGGGWTVKDGDYDGPGGYRVQLNGGTVIVTYPNGQQQFQYMGGSGGRTLTFTFPNAYPIGTKVRVESTAQTYTQSGAAEITAGKNTIYDWTATVTATQN